MIHRWLVLVAAIFVSTFEFGLLFSLSALYMPILETFESDRATTALVQSVSLGVTMSVGIITGLIVKLLGCRKVSLIGAVLASLGYAVSYVAESIYFLIVFLGIISGIGVAFMYVSSTVSVANYFEEPGKSLALAAVQTGVGIAGVFYPYLLTFLHEQYGLQGTFLVIGGLFLNSFAACILYSGPARKYIDKTDNVTSRNEDNLSTSSEHEIVISERTPLLAQQKSHVNNVFPKKHKIVYEEKTCLYVKNEFLFYNYKGQAIYKLTGKHTHKTESGVGEKDSEFVGNISRTFKEALNCCRKLFRDKRYILFLIGDSLVVSFANGFIAVVVDIFTTKGFSSEEGLSAFLPYFIASIFGRILPGLLQQSPRINPLIFPVGCAILGFLGQLSVLLSSEYAIMMLGCCLAGLSVGGAISASSVVAIRLVEPETFPIAFGLIMSLSGILTAAIAPLNGFIRDTTGSYDLVLVVTAGVQTLGGVILVIVLVINRTKKNCATGRL